MSKASDAPHILPFPEEEGEMQEEAVKDVDTEILLLDMEIMQTLLNKRLVADEKCYRYYMAVVRYLYKKDPRLKYSQFRFELQTNDNGEETHIFTPYSSSDSFSKYCRKAIPTLIGPAIGAVFTLWRTFSGSNSTCVSGGGG